MTRRLHLLKNAGVRDFSGRPPTSLDSSESPKLYLDLIAVYSIVLPVLTKPLPLQAFWPLQEFAALLQALWPLQALAPLHTTCAEAAVAKVLTAKTAAAVATIVLVFIVFSLCGPHPVVADEVRNYVPHCGIAQSVKSVASAGRGPNARRLVCLHTH